MSNQVRDEAEGLNERNQDGGPIDSNVISAILRQLHLLHDSVTDLQTVISSLSTVAPTIFFVVDAQAVKVKIHI